MIKHDELLRRIYYKPETGKFYWRTPRPGKNRPDLEAGGQTTHGPPYIRICIDRRLIGAHRLAWFYVHGEWPNGEIDHINGDGLDNRIANLRPATRAQRGMNTRRQKRRTLPKGVHWRPKRDVYHAYIVFEGKQRFLGSFKTPEAAHEAYCEASARLHGEFSRTD